MQLEIITPDKKLYEGEATGVSLPGTDGSFKILNHHAPMVASLKQGIVKVDTASGIQQFPINGGIVECGDNKVVVLA
ncbi:MAG: F0F1 ATP synthase subunit epsilon [Bacteroidetes bacterium]|nr:F0F1 ATP synthase subunit epsilon [Bacteroidota bacterium]